MAAGAGASEGVRADPLEDVVLAAVGRHPWNLVRDPPWVHLARPETILPDQGWKLHVSAHRGSFTSVLTAVLPVLAEARVAAKVVDGIDDLDQLNDGAFGLTQVGKVITVYPGDDGAAVALAADLARVTAGLDGPPVPFDARLAPGSVVHYRYGSFAGRSRWSAFGGEEPVVTGPDGRDVVDDRRRPVPEGVPDPFVAGGVAAPPARPRPLVGGRYAAVHLLRRTARGTVSAGVDLHEARPCILKRATAWACVDPAGHDARDRLRHEAEVLAHLAGGGVDVPPVLDLVVDGDDLVLVLGPGPPATLADVVTGRCEAGRSGDSRFARRVGTAVARAVHRAHEQGVVLGDLSPTNFLVTGEDADPRVVIVDLEVARWSDGPTGPATRGTTGYSAPAHMGGGAPDRRDDVFALGALLWYLATGRPPPLEPGLVSLTRDRFLDALADGAADPALGDLVARCLDRDPSGRPSTAAAVADGLARAPAAGRAGASSRSFRSVPPTQPAVGAARAAVERLRSDLRAAVAAADPDLSVGRGTAGLLLAAAAVAEVAPTPGLLDDVQVAADDLVTRLAARGTGVAPGLFTGDAGAAVALVHPLVRTPARLPVAVDLVGGAAVATHPSFDVVNGTAGVLRALVLVAEAVDRPGGGDALGDVDRLHVRGADLAERLLAQAATVPPDERWRIPEGFGRAVGQPCLGYGHGAAGIADVLLDWARHVGSRRAAAVAADVLAPASAGGRTDGTFDPTGPELVGGGPSPAVWCRGAGGLVAPLARTGDAAAASAALDAVAAARWTGPCRCHGLAGQVEILLDSGRVDQARRLGRLLEAFAAPDPAGGGSLLDGNAGVAVALARLNHPDARPWLSQLFGAPGPCTTPGGATARAPSNRKDARWLMTLQR